MPVKEEMDLDGYQYDEMWDTYSKRLSFNETAFSNSISSPHNCRSDSDYDIAWDDSWDFGSSASSQPESELEMEVWSIYLPDEDIFYEAVYFKDPDYCRSTYEPEFEPDEEYLPDDTNLLSKESREILDRPLQYYAICEELSQPSNQSLVAKSSSSPVPGFKLFDSVVSIMQLLEAMPSLKRENMQSGPSSNLAVQPEGLTPDIYPLSLPNPNLWLPLMQLSQGLGEMPNMQLSSQQLSRLLGTKNGLQLTKQFDMRPNLPSTNLRRDLHLNLGKAFKKVKLAEQIHYPMFSSPSAYIFFTMANEPNIFWVNRRYAGTASSGLGTRENTSHLYLIGDLWRPLVEKVQDEVAQVFDPGGFSK